MELSVEYLLWQALWQGVLQPVESEFDREPFDSVRPSCAADFLFHNHVPLWKLMLTATCTTVQD